MKLLGRLDEIGAVDGSFLSLDGLSLEDDAPLVELVEDVVLNTFDLGVARELLLDPVAISEGRGNEL